MVIYKFTSQDTYDLLKSLDMSELGNGIIFDDAIGTVTVENEDLFSILLDENMNIEGFDENYNPTAYGRRIESLIGEIAYMNEQFRYNSLKH